MRIIHYIDRLKAGDLLSDSILRLTTAEKEYADVLTVTRNDDFKKIISKEKPDVVHIHACWDYPGFTAHTMGFGNRNSRRSLSTLGT